MFDVRCSMFQTVGLGDVFYRATFQSAGSGDFPVPGPLTQSRFILRNTGPNLTDRGCVRSTSRSGLDSIFNGARVAGRVAAGLSDTAAVRQIRTSPKHVLLCFFAKAPVNFPIV